MHRTTVKALLVSVLLAGTAVSALAEVTVLRGSPRRDTNPVMQNDPVVNDGISGGSTIDNSGTLNAVTTGSANAGGEIGNPPPGLINVPNDRNRLRR